MNDDLLSYYNAELEYLRDLGAEFARSYPKVAGRLQLDADQCEDPHVERLLEGFAFLAARVRKKLDDEFPEITEALLGLLYPHYLRPLPSMTIVQFLPGPDVGKLSTGHRIDRGARLNSRPVAGMPCSFRTAYPVTLWPIEVVSARLDPDRVTAPGKPADAVALLQIALRCTPPTTFATLPLDELRFHLAGEGPLPFALYELLINNACRVTIRDAATGETVILPEGSLRPGGLEPDEGLIPDPPRAFPGYRLLQEYFALPEKFLFVDLGGLRALRGRRFGENIEVLIFLNQPPRGEAQVGADNFRLACAPAVNLFTTVAEPMTLSHTQYEYRVVPDIHRPLATEVHSIDSVTSLGTFLEEPVDYAPFYSFRHDDRNAGNQPYWIASRRQSVRKDDPGTEVYLMFVDRDFNPSLPATRTITVHATCSNRDLPARLPFGGDQADLSLEAAAPVSRARCLRKPTKSLRPALRRGSHRRLISQLSLNHLSLAGTGEGLEALREVLRMNDLADTLVTRQQIQGIVGLSSRRAAGRTGRAIGNAVCLGLEVTIEFDEASYVGSGLFLLAGVLERFLGLYTTINSFSQLVARSRQREGIIKRWPPRSGERTLL
jgi:type VI secretion system protein ImpG